MIVGLLIWLLTAFSVDDQACKLEPVRCGAAVSAAYASLRPKLSKPDEVVPDVVPDKPAKCCGECNGTGIVTMPDGHRIACSCPDDCECKTKPKAAAAGCPDGKCKVVVRRR